MKLAWPVEIAGVGASIPTKTLTNDDFATRLDTSDEWIVQRTGIRERRIVDEGKGTLSMATDASRAALADAGMSPEDIDLIVVATITPEHTLPATSCELQAALGCRQVPAFDIQAACSGFVWAAINGAQFVQTGMAGNVLVVGSETLSRITDYEDRGTCVLFGDASGAAVLRRATDAQREILAIRMGADGVRGKSIWIPAGGAAEPASIKTVNERLHYMKMAGREVYKFAVTTMSAILVDTADDAGVNLDDVALIIPHQSNLRIIESACDRARVPLDRVLINIDRYGNTSAASVPLALEEAYRTGRIKRGDLVMTVAFGAGLTWGSILLRF